MDRIEITKWQDLLTNRGERKDLGWDEFLARFSRAPEEDSDEKKRSWPGWSPAVFDQDQRGNKFVTSITALVLDYDALHIQLAAIVERWAPFAGLVHTTFSHSPVLTSARVILRLSRPVTPSEHAKLWAWACARSLAGGIGLDVGTKDAARFWYLPRVRRGFAYVCEELRGAPLDVDGILAENVRSLTSDARTHGGRLLERYCSAVRGAPEGERNTTLNRVAWIMGGLAASGACSEQEAQRALEHAGREAGLTEREVLATVSRAIDAGKARPLNVRAVAREPDIGRWSADIAQPIEPQLEWRDRLLTKMTQQGSRVENCLENARVLAAYHPKWASLRFNAFADRVEVDGRPWKDADDIAFATWAQRGCDADLRVMLSVADAHAGVVLGSRDRSFHPVRDYLESLTWDGKNRIDTWLVDMLGATASSYVREVGRKWLIAAVARVFDPGCQVDSMLVLESDQGTGKTSILRELAGEWYVSVTTQAGDKDSYLAIRGAWIVELEEMAAFLGGGRMAGRAKAFISQRVDKYRAPYGRHMAEHPRDCVFVGTTNNSQYLNDATGGRRFWCLAVERADTERLRDARDQLWAEAVSAHKAGETWHLSPEVERVARSEQESRRECDAWEEIIADYIEKNGITKITVHYALRHILGIEVGRWTKLDQSRVNSALVVICKKPEWKYQAVRDPATGKVMKGYKK